MEINNRYTAHSTNKAVRTVERGANRRPRCTAHTSFLSVSYTHLYVQPLLARGFALEALVEPQPAREMLDAVPGMADELRRPMMLILKARKPRR